MIISICVDAVNFFYFALEKYFILQTAKTLKKIIKSMKKNCPRNCHGGFGGWLRPNFVIF